MTMAAADRTVFLHRIFYDLVKHARNAREISSTLFMKPEQGFWDSTFPLYFTFCFCSWRTWREKKSFAHTHKSA